MQNIYQVEFNNQKGNVQTLEMYKGKMIIIVNTASKCGFTAQFEELEKLYQKYRNQLIIIGFPSGDFKQELTGQKEVQQFCQLNYGVTFPIMEISHVRGPEINLLFKYLVDNKKGFLTKAIKWNFTKFLITKKGEIYKRYAPKTNPLAIEKDIEKLLEQE